MLFSFTFFFYSIFCDVVYDDYVRTEPRDAILHTILYKLLIIQMTDPKININIFRNVLDTDMS